MEEQAQKPTIQLTGFKSKEKDALVKLLFKLDCTFIDSEKYADCSHLIAKKVSKSEKWLAACAAGKWVLTKEYVIDSVKSGRWLDETTYEWGCTFEKDSQMKSAPKRWREVLTLTGSPGAFHRWKVVLLIKESDKRRDAFQRVLLAGKATLCDPENAKEGITHVFTNNRNVVLEQKKNVIQAPYYPVQYLGDFLLESQNALQSSTEEVQLSHTLLEKNKDDITEDMLVMPLDDSEDSFWKRLCLAQAVHHKYAELYSAHEEIFPEVKHIETLRVRLNRIEGLLEGHFFSEAIEDLNFLLPHCVPPVCFLQTLLMHMLQGNLDAFFSCRIFDIFYNLLHLHPPWKSPSMQKYYLEVLQCPVCKKGTWSLLEMLVRSCLDQKDFCHPMLRQEIEFSEQRRLYGSLLKYIADVLEAETQALSKRLCEWTDSRRLEVMPQAVLVGIFWSETKSSVFLTKPLYILVDWVIRSHREKIMASDVLKHQVAYLLYGILGAVVEYWILLGLLLNKYMVHHISVDLANYISILCDDFSVEECESLICSIPSPWLQMFLADSVFRTLCLKNNLSLSSEPLSLHKMVCSYLPALSQMGTCEVRREQKVKGRKPGQRPSLGPQRALMILNDNKRSHAEVLPDLPDLSFDTPLPKKLRRKLENAFVPKENFRNIERLMLSCKQNYKGETALHRACKQNKVEKLALLLSSPGADINVKDYAGWTPLHEACNHGSTGCVQEILQRCPEADLLSQVDGVTPLHDALSNGHVEIGKLLLQYGEETGDQERKKMSQSWVQKMKKDTSETLDVNWVTSDVSKGPRFRALELRLKAVRVSDSACQPVKKYIALARKAADGSDVNQVLNLLGDLINLVDVLELTKRPLLLRHTDLDGKLPLDYIASQQLKEELFSILQLPQTLEEFSVAMEKDLSVQNIEFASFLLCRVFLNFCSIYGLSSKIASAHVQSHHPSVNTVETLKKPTSFTDWLVEHHAWDLQTLCKLPELLPKLSKTLSQCDGFHTRILLAVLTNLITPPSVASNS